MIKNIHAECHIDTFNNLVEYNGFGSTYCHSYITYTIAMHFYPINYFNATALTPHSDYVLEDPC